MDSSNTLETTQVERKKFALTVMASTDSSLRASNGANISQPSSLRGISIKP